MAYEFFGRQRERHFYTAGCENKMAVSVTGPRAVNELGGPVIPGRPTVWACLRVDPLDMPRTPYRASEGKRSQKPTMPYHPRHHFIICTSFISSINYNVFIVLHCLLKDHLCRKVM